MRIGEFYRSRLIDSSLVYAQTANELSNKIDFLKGKAASTRLLGFLAYQKGDYKKTLEFYQTSLTFYKELKDPYNIGKLTYLVGVAYTHLGDYKTAQNNFFASLAIFEKNNFKIDAADALIGISNIFGRLNNIDQENEYLLKALKIKEEMKDDYGLAAIYLNFGRVLVKQNKMDEAIEYTKKSLEISERLKNVKSQINATGNIGSLYSLKGDYKNGLKYFLKCAGLAEGVNDRGALSNIYGNLGQLYSEVKQIDKAKMYLEKALDMSIESGDVDQVKLNYNALYEHYMSVKDYKSAVMYLKEYVKVKDSLITESTAFQLNELQTKYDTDKKEKEIALLNKDKELQTTQIKQQKIINYAIVFGLLIVCVFSILLFNRLSVTRKQKALIEVQKKEVEIKSEIIEEKQKEILDSIHYAKRIQDALLSHQEMLDQNVKSNVIFFKPKDIVSGDFYWATKKDDLFYLAVCDSTGHGVPGAFMSLLNINFLNEAINEKNITEPNQVFNYVRERLVNSISKEGQQDGFDGILLCLNKRTGKLSYSAAHNAPVVIRDGIVNELAKDKMPVGKGERLNSFACHDIQLESNDTLFLYTDGYADQFGGPDGKKFLYKRMNDLLSTLNLNESSTCKEKLSQTFASWKGQLEQVDDVLVIGIKI